jgi:hypothetical protein
MKGRSFYYCIAQNCLEDAVKCVETAKGNDSIAYLRFRFRDPRVDDASNQTTSDEDTDASMTDVTVSENEDEDGGSPLNTTSSEEARPSTFSAPSTTHSSASNDVDNMDVEIPTASRPDHSTRNSSGNSVPQTEEAIFDAPTISSPSSSDATSPDIQGLPADRAIELEAVVSCTSDGLVVILRRARPIMPGAGPDGAGNQAQGYPHGFFAAPWGRDPVYIPAQVQPYPGWVAGMDANPERVPVVADTSPGKDYFMNSIRDVAVFAWALTGINGCLAEYSRGNPLGESQPPGGFPVWAPQAHDSDSGISQTSHTTRDPFGDPGLGNHPTTSGALR